MHPVLLRAAIVFLVALPFLLRAWAGRLAPRAFLAPIAFLATRLPVLIAWALGAGIMAWTVIGQAAAHGHGAPSDIAMLLAISLVSGGGFAVLVVGPAFFAYRALGPRPELPLDEGERVVRELDANHFRGGEARGGRLRVTDRRLVFVPHRFNVQLQPCTLSLGDIRSVRAEGERFVVVDTRGGAEEVLVVLNAARLVAELAPHAPGTLTQR